MKKALLVITFFIVTGLLAPLSKVRAETLASKLKGRILLQVQQHGEAWYINPQSQQRHFLGRPADAFALMRQLGIGITNLDLQKIPVALDHLSGLDTDSDGLPDALEDAVGTDKSSPDTDGDGRDDKMEMTAGENPAGAGVVSAEALFAHEQSGKILLQVESHGEAWYVNPLSAKRYFMGRPDDAFALMRALGLGVTNQDLNTIAEAGNGSPNVVNPPSTSGGNSTADTDPDIIAAKQSLAVIGKAFSAADTKTLKEYLSAKSDASSLPTAGQFESIEFRGARKDGLFVIMTVSLTPKDQTGTPSFNQDLLFVKEGGIWKLGLFETNEWRNKQAASAP